MEEHYTVYSLATFDNNTVEGVRPLSEDEYNTHFAEISLLEKFANEEQLFKLVELNHSDLIEKVSHYLNEYKLDKGMGYTKITSQYLDLNRLILNLLSSIRTYLDHTETRLKREFGNTSAEYLFFQKLTSEAFDNNFAYRFLSKLRNYAQHCGLPSGSFTIHSELSEDTLTLYLERDSLIEKFDKWGTLVKEELQKMEARFDILPLLEIKVELLYGINKELSKLLSANLVEASKSLLDLILEIEPDGTKTPLLLKASGHIDSPTLHLRHFPYEIISRMTGFPINVT